MSTYNLTSSLVFLARTYQLSGPSLSSSFPSFHSFFHFSSFSKTRAIFKSYENELGGTEIISSARLSITVKSNLKSEYILAYWLWIICVTETAKTRGKVRKAIHYRFFKFVYMVIVMIFCFRCR